MKKLFAIIILALVGSQARAALTDQGITIDISLAPNGTNTATWSQTCGSTDDSTIRIFKSGTFVVDGSLLAGTLGAAMTAKKAAVKAVTGCN